MHYHTRDTKHLKKRIFVWALIPCVVLVAIGSILWTMRLPWMANHFGYALPGQGGLPFRITYAGRTYANLATCARASWCPSVSDTAKPSNLCWKDNDIRQHYDWPLVQVGSLSTLFGSPYPLMASQSNVSSKLTVMIIFVAKVDGCYVPYELEGGP